MQVLWRAGDDRGRTRGGQWSGGFVGFCYACYIGILMSIFGRLWGALRGEPDPPEERMHIAAGSGKGHILLAVVSSGILGLVTQWYLGVTVALLQGILIAGYATARGRHLGKQRSRTIDAENRELESPFASSVTSRGLQQSALGGAHATA